MLYIKINIYIYRSLSALVLLFLLCVGKKRLPASLTLGTKRAYVVSVTVCTSSATAFIVCGERTDCLGSVNRGSVCRGVFLYHTSDIRKRTSVSSLLLLLLFLV